VKGPTGDEETKWADEDAVVHAPRLLCLHMKLCWTCSREAWYGQVPGRNVAQGTGVVVAVAASAAAVVVVMWWG